MVDQITDHLRNFNTTQMGWAYFRCDVNRTWASAWRTFAHGWLLSFPVERLFFLSKEHPVFSHGVQNHGCDLCRVGRMSKEAKRCLCPLSLSFRYCMRALHKVCHHHHRLLYIWKATMRIFNTCVRSWWASSTMHIIWRMWSCTRASTMDTICWMWIGRRAASVKRDLQNVEQMSSGSEEKNELGQIWLFRHWYWGKRYQTGPLRLFASPDFLQIWCWSWYFWSVLVSLFGPWKARFKTINMVD